MVSGLDSWGLEDGSRIVGNKAKRFNNIDIITKGVYSPCSSKIKIGNFLCPIWQVEGEKLYGLMRSESGVHRLVRISPFDSGGRRHTSFASVWVYPVVDDDIKIDLDEKDLRVDTYRSSGAGGQHVNTTDSAVRITHIPTKIVVQCQNDRSQHKNKETCMQMLKARLYNHELEKREKESVGEKDQKKDIGWGHQIRSYVLHPYRLVKDNRTNFETSDPDKVLNGELDSFLESSLFKINDYKIYRVFPNSEVQYLHPKDGVFPEKLNEGRLGVGNIGHSIGKNPQPVNVKFTGKNTFDG